MNRQFWGNKKILSCLLGVIGTSVLNLLTINSTQAASLNLNTWATWGDVKTETPFQADLSTDGIADDDFNLGESAGTFNFSSTPAGTVGFVSPSLDEFLGIDASLLDLGGIAYEGSALKQVVAVEAGEILSFEWNFLTNETSFSLDPNIGSLNDYAFFLVNDEVNVLADINDAIVPSSFFVSETGNRSFQYRFNRAGSYTIAFGAVDIDDFTVTSALSVSHVTLTPSSDPTSVPETTPILGLLILAGLATGRRSIPKRSR
jgi:hypothetical protein